MVVMIFSVRQVQVKCREQPTPLYIAFIDLKIGRLLTFSSGRAFSSYCYRRLDVLPTAEHHCLLPRQHEAHHQVCRRSFKTLPRAQRRETVLCPCTDFVRYIILLTSEVYIQQSTEGVHLHT